MLYSHIVSQRIQLATHTHTHSPCATTLTYLLYKNKLFAKHTQMYVNCHSIF